VWSAELNEKGLSSVFVIFRVVDKLVECRETYKHLKKTYAAEVKATTSVVKCYHLSVSV
jgi:hypothetical protein